MKNTQSSQLSSLEETIGGKGANVRRGLKNSGLDRKSRANFHWWQVLALSADAVSGPIAVPSSTGNNNQIIWTFMPLNLAFDHNE